MAPVSQELEPPEIPGRFSMNNRIKALERMAYGYRDSSYYFLRILDAFPSNVRRTQRKSLLSGMSP